MGLSALQKAGPTRSGRPHIPRPTLHITGKLLGICSVCWMCTSHGYGVLGGHRHHEFPKDFSGAREGAEVGEIAAVGAQQLGRGVLEGARDLLKGGALLGVLRHALPAQPAPMLKTLAAGLHIICNLAGSVG